jgi:hypothetical protein
VDGDSIAVYLTKVSVKGFERCCISDAVDEADDCGMAVKRMAILGISAQKMKALTVQIETVTLIDKGRILHALCIECMN